MFMGRILLITEGHDSFVNSDLKDDQYNYVVIALKRFSQFVLLEVPSVEEKPRTARLRPGGQVVYSKRGASFFSFHGFSKVHISEAKEILRGDKRLLFNKALSIEPSITVMACGHCENI